MALQTITSQFRHHPRYTCTQRQRELSHLIAVHDNLSPALNLIYLSNDDYNHCMKQSVKQSKIYHYLTLGLSLGRCIELNNDHACIKSINQVMDEYEHFQSNNQSNNQSVSQSNNQVVLGFKIKRPLPSSVQFDQSITQSVNQSKPSVHKVSSKNYAYEWLVFPVNQTVNQSNNQSISYTIVISTICKCLERIYLRFVDLIIQSESSNQLGNQSNNQSTNQSVLFDLLFKLDRKMKQFILDPIFADFQMVTDQSIDHSIMQLINHTFIDQAINPLMSLANNFSNNQSNNHYHTIPNFIKQESLSSVQEMH